MFVADVMTPHPVTTTVSTPVKEALALLDRYSVTSLPVVDTSGRIQGVVSEADLIRDRVRRDPRGHELPEENLPPSPPVAVGDVYTPHAVTARAHDDLADAVELMTSTTVKSLPVVDRKGKVVGVLSRSDIVHVLAQADSVIETAVGEAFAELGRAGWLVEVRDGVVDVDGPGTPQERELARIAAGTVAGVVDVRVG